VNWTKRQTKSSACHPTKTPKVEMHWGSRTQAEGARLEGANEVRERWDSDFRNTCDWNNVSGKILLQHEEAGLGIFWAPRHLETAAKTSSKLRQFTTGTLPVAGRTKKK